MMNTLSKYFGVGTLLAVIVACTDEDCQPLSGNAMQIKVEAISSSNGWSTTRSSLGSDTLDLTGRPDAYSELDEEWALSAYVTDSYLSTTNQTEAPATRGIPLQSATELPSMALAVYNGGTSGYNTNTTPIWKRVQAVNQNNSGSWSIPGEGVVWPTGTTKLTFFAFSPYPASDNGIAWASDGRTLTYTVPTTVAAQPDLCLAIPIKDRTNEDGSGNHIVTLSMKHALTAVTVKASAHKVRIISAAIKNVKTQGRLALDASAPAWTNVGVNGNRAFAVNESVESVSMIDITKRDGHLLMVPQTLDDAGILELVFDDLSKTPSARVTKTVRLKTLIPTWVAGKQIFYNLQMKTAYSLTVNPTSINLAGEKGSYANGISYTTNNPKTPTVTVNQGWITNMNIVNGKITFDYSENPSTTLERTATITVTSGLTTKTVVVKQSPKIVLPKEGANCYIAAPSGATIQIPVFQANKDGVTRIAEKDVLTVELVWQDTPGALGTSGSCISSFKIVGIGSNALIEVKPGAREGNAVVAVKVGGVIRWSWHIWVTGYDPNKTNRSFNGKVWFDRDLGAFSNAAESSNALGLLYQWGRKDPFTAANSPVGGSEKPAYNASGAQIRFECIVVNKVSNNMEYTIQKPTTFIYASGNPFQWTGKSTKPEMWKEDVKTTYDPCPLGWRVPTADNFGNAADFVSSPTTSTVTHKVLGNFPLVGDRNWYDGKTIGNTTGRRWSASLKYVEAWAKWYDGRYLSCSRGYTSEISSVATADGMAVRCVKE